MAQIPPYVEPDQIIESAWGNSVVDNIKELKYTSNVVNITRHNNFDGSLYVYKVYRFVWLVGNLTKNGGNISNANITFGTIPDGYRPIGAHSIVGTVTQNAAHRITVAANGTITAPSLTINTDQSIHFSSFFMGTAPA